RAWAVQVSASDELVGRSMTFMGLESSARLAGTSSSVNVTGERVLTGGKVRRMGELAGRLSEEVAKELGRYVRAYGGYRKVGEAVGVNSKYVGLLVRGQAAPSVLIANELATVLGMGDKARARLVGEAREGRGYDREGTAR